MNHDNKESIVLGGGCFWCLEAAYQRVDGVINVTSGYAGGEVENPPYEEVSTGTTGHAEVVDVHFDTEKISLHEILEIFFTIHDPTTPNRQGADIGTQYRSIILYRDEEQRQTAEKVIAKLNQTVWDNQIVTELQPLEDFYKAEDYHQNYYEKNPSNAYCQTVINPKLKKLQEKFSSKLKEDE